MWQTILNFFAGMFVNWRNTLAAAAGPAARDGYYFNDAG